MIKRLTVENADEVNALMRDPEIYPGIIDDSCPGPEDFDATEALENDEMYILGWHENNSLAGLWLLHPWNAITYQVHVCMNAAYRGKSAIQGAEDAKRWMFENTRCRKIVALVPDYRSSVKIIAKAIGFYREGRLRNSFLKDGMVMDEVIYGLEKEGGE